VASPDGLKIAATCTIAELERSRKPPEWIAAPLPLPRAADAKAQGERAINAAAPAIANAVANATGVRFPELPLTPDRINEKLGSWTAG